VTAAALLIVVVMMFVFMLVTAAALFIVVVMMFVLMLVTAATLLIVVVVMMFMLMFMMSRVMMCLFDGSDNNSGFNAVCHLVDLGNELIGKFSLYLEFFHGEVKYGRLDTLKLADSFLYFSAAVGAVQIRYRKVFFHKVTILSHMNGCSYV